MNKNQTKVIQAIKTYPKLKAKFSEFKTVLNDKLGKNDVFNFKIASSNDITLEMIIFDRPVQISFSMIYGTYDPIGQLILKRIISKDKRELLWTIFFDTYGNLFQKSNGSESRFNLTNPIGVHYILIELVDRYINQLATSILTQEALSPKQGAALDGDSAALHARQ